MEVALSIGSALLAGFACEVQTKNRMFFVTGAVYLGLTAIGLMH